MCETECVGRGGLERGVERGTEAENREKKTQSQAESERQIGGVMQDTSGRDLTSVNKGLCGVIREVIIQLSEK